LDDYVDDQKDRIVAVLTQQYRKGGQLGHEQREKSNGEATYFMREITRL